MSGKGYIKEEVSPRELMPCPKNCGKCFRGKRGVLVHLRKCSFGDAKQEIMTIIDLKASSKGSNFQQIAKLTDISGQIVFCHKPLLERILSYAIRCNHTEKISRTQLASLRLVRKSWVEAIESCLRKLGEPLFQLKLTKDNSLLGTPYVRANGKLLDQFTVTMIQRKGNIPPFSLNIRADYFRRENYQSLLDCLTSCGNEIISLIISLPKSSSMTYNFPFFNLSNLKRISVHFSSEKIFDLSSAPISGHYANTAIFFIQAILTSSLQATFLQFSASGTDCLPCGLETLRLPRTLTTVFLTCSPFMCSDWRPLTQKLPQLTNLSLHPAVGHPEVDRRIFHKILQNVRISLQFLELMGYPHQNSILVKNPILLLFPLMESLVSLKITGTQWQISDRQEALQQCLPKLERLSILSHSEDMYRKWTDFGNFSSVRRVCVSLIEKNLSKNDIHYVLPFNVERMQRLHFAFDNLTYLRMSICGRGTVDSLQYLFSEIRTLKTLSISLTGRKESFTCDDWDSLLTGIPKEIANSLRKCPDYWECIHISDHVRFPTLRKLEELNVFALYDKFTSDSDNSSSLISEIAFHFAMFLMPKLKYLYLSGDFQASKEIQTEWKKLKGTRLYYYQQ